MHRFGILAFATIAAVPAAAQNLRQQMFSNETSCYARVYSATHLASHPVQQVTAIALTPQQRISGEERLLLRLSVTVRGTRETYIGVGYCDDAGATVLTCGMEGDAGGFILAAAKNGALTLTVGRNGVSFEGNADFITLEGLAGDDREFLLQPTNQCQ